MFWFRSLDLIEPWEIDIIIVPVSMVKKLRLRNYHLKVAESGTFPGSSDANVQALSPPLLVATPKSGL